MVIIALIGLACPIVLRAVHNNPLKYSESNKKEKTEATIEKNSIETLTTDVKETKKKESEDKIKKIKEEELQKEYSEYLEKIPFGNFIELKTENEGKVSLSIARAVSLPETDERVQTVKKEIRDVGQMVEFEYDVYVSEKSFLFNGTIFNFFDADDEQGAVILDELEEGITLKEGERKTAKVCVAFKNKGESTSIKIGNARFIGKIE